MNEDHNIYIYICTLHLSKLFWLPRTPCSFDLILSCPVLALSTWFPCVCHWNVKITDILYTSTYFSQEFAFPARLPCTLYKAVVWGQSHGSRASSHVPSVQSTGTLLKTTMLWPRLDSDHHRRLFLSCALPILLLLHAVATCHMLPGPTNQKFWSSYAQSMCANKFKYVLFVYQ